MTDIEAYNQLSSKAPTGFRLNELIAFSYPMRRLRLDVLVNKLPDSSLTNVYTVLLRAIQAGFHNQSKLFDFLGLGSTDEFILRELFSLRERGYVDLISEKWIVTSNGENFLLDSKILRVEEEEEFEFLIDGLSGDVLSIKENPATKIRLDRHLDTELKYPHKSPEILEGKFQELADVFKQEQKNKSYLISYTANEINRDYEEWCNYWLVEYIPDNNTSQEAILEVRSYDNLKIIKSLTSKFNSEYRHFIYTLSNSDRIVFDEIATLVEETIHIEATEADFRTLSIWETKQKFIEALKNVKEKILIESPWIRKATLEYLPLIERLLENEKQVIILYGISEKDEHDIFTLKKLEELQKQFTNNFKLIHLPTHFSKMKSKLTGTHRKLVIKDNDFYILGSFNFLSFGKNENNQVANEESLMINKDVVQKWNKVLHEYSLNLL